MTDGGIYDPRSQERRIVEDQRDLERRFVGKDPMSRFAVISQRLAVIRGHDDQCVRISALIENGLQHRTERRIDRGDFSRIRIRGKSGSVRLWRRIGKVRLVQVDPRK